MGNIVIDASNSATYMAKSKSLAVTTPSTDNRIIVCAVNGRSADPFTLSSLKMDGSSPTFSIEKRRDSAADTVAITAYWLSPSVGSHTVIVTWSKAANRTASMALWTLSNVDISSPHQSSAIVSQTYSGLDDGAMGFGAQSGYGTPTLGADQTALQVGTNHAVWYTIASNDGTLTATWDRDEGSSIMFAPAPEGPPSIKTINGIVIASIKTWCGVGIADIKSVQGLT